MIVDGSRTFWNFVIDFGDLAVLTPATCAICAVLWLRRQRREALFWGASFAGCIAVTMLLKSAIGQVEFDLFSRRFAAASMPSGHTTMSVAFYGGLAAFLRASLPGWAGAAGAALLLILTGLIAVSTIVLDWHTGIDVAAGLLLGSVFAAFPAWTARLRTHRPREGLAVAMTAAVVIAAFHGIRLDAKIAALRHVDGGGSAIRISADVGLRVHDGLYYERDLPTFTPLSVCPLDQLL